MVLYELIHDIVYWLVPPLYIEGNIQNSLTAIGGTGWAIFERRAWRRHR